MKFIVISLLLCVNIVFGYDENEFTRANNLFAAKAYKEIAKNSDGNFLMSPLSLEIILSLTQSGARDETAEEMRNVLRLPNSNEKIKSAVRALLPTIKNIKNYTFYAANKMYVKENLKIQKSFRSAAVDVYQSEIENIDFTTMRQEVAKTINEWVAKHTDNKIHDLIDSKILDENTRTILINALYFKAKWKIEFKKSATNKTDFYKTPQNTIKVDTMHIHKQIFNYYESSAFHGKVLELIYNGGDASFIIALPNAIDGLSILEDQIESVFDTDNFSRQFVNVALPKFKMEKTIDFKGILQNLGMMKAFNVRTADFSGIAGKKGDLVISDVIQKCFIDVSEEGTQAAAATFGTSTFGYSRPRTIRVRNFIVDHPFLFYIKVKGIIAFVGRMTSPQY